MPVKERLILKLEATLLVVVTSCSARNTPGKPELAVESHHYVEEVASLSVLTPGAMNKHYLKKCAD
jgi:hypothetical protein